MTATGGHEVDPLVLRDFSKYISDLASSFEVIRIDAQHEGLSDKGFTGPAITRGGFLPGTRERHAGAPDQNGHK